MLAYICDDTRIMELENTGEKHRPWMGDHYPATCLYCSNPGPASGVMRVFNALSRLLVFVYEHISRETIPKVTQ